MRILISLLLTLFLAVPATANPTSTAWRVVQSTGEVSVLSQGLTPIALNLQAPLPVEATVRTGATGQAILVRGGETILVRPNSELKLPSAAATGDWTSLQQAAGSILLKVTKKPSAHFEVRTPYLAAVVKGTTFEVNVDKDGASVRVTEGLVEVLSPDGRQREMTPGGFTTRISRKDKQLKRSKSVDLPVPARRDQKPTPLLNAAPAPVAGPNFVALTQPIEAVTDAGVSSDGLVKDVTKREDNSKARSEDKGDSDKVDNGAGNSLDGQTGDTASGNTATDPAAAPEPTPSVSEPNVATPELTPTDSNHAEGDKVVGNDKEKASADTPEDNSGSNISGGGSNNEQAATPEPTPVADDPAPVPAETDKPRNEHAADNGRNNAPETPANDNPGSDHGGPDKDKEPKDKVGNEPALPDESKSKKSKS